MGKKGGADMRRYVKLILLGALMMLVMCGCDPVAELNIYTNDNMKGHFIDMLIPIGEDDEMWTDFAPTEKTYYSYTYDSFANVTPDSEIVKYSEDGFRSMLMHMKNVCYPSRELCFGFDFEDENERERFCKKYGEFRLAEIDGEGNICCVTDTYSLSSGMFHNIKSIDYYSESGEVRATYIADDKFTSYVLCIALISVTVNIILLAVALFLRKGFENSRRWAAICGVCGVPALVYTLLGAYDSFMSMNSFTAAAVDFAHSWLRAAALLICVPLGTFIIFFLRYRKEKRGK